MTDKRLSLRSLSAGLDRCDKFRRLHEEREREETEVKMVKVPSGGYKRDVARLEVKKEADGRYCRQVNAQKVAKDLRG